VVAGRRVVGVGCRLVEGRGGRGGDGRSSAPEVWKQVRRDGVSGGGGEQGVVGGDGSGYVGALGPAPWVRVRAGPWRVGVGAVGGGRESPGWVGGSGAGEGERPMVSGGGGCGAVGGRGGGVGV